jgi:hypothetical protein
MTVISIQSNHEVSQKRRIGMAELQQLERIVALIPIREDSKIVWQGVHSHIEHRTVYKALQLKVNVPTDEVEKRWNRAVMTEVLFASVRETLLTLLRDPKWLGATPGIVATLHPWSRTLALHAHVHCLISGGGLTVQGSWQPVRTGFLLPVAVMRALFRGKVLGAIERLWLTGQLREPPHYPENGVRRVLVEAARHQWNIRIAERYPHGRGVMKYLARYVRGGPIKDHRFVAGDGQQVTFWYGVKTLGSCNLNEAADAALRRVGT